MFEIPTFINFSILIAAIHGWKVVMYKKSFFPTSYAGYFLFLKIEFAYSLWIFLSANKYILIFGLSFVWSLWIVVTVIYAEVVLGESSCGVNHEIFTDTSTTLSHTHTHLLPLSTSLSLYLNLSLACSHRSGCRIFPLCRASPTVVCDADIRYTRSRDRVPKRHNCHHILPLLHLLGVDNQHI